MDSKDHVAQEAAPASNSSFPTLAALLRHRCFQPDRKWPGRRAIVPVDICQAVLEVFAWAVFLSGIINMGLLYLGNSAIAFTYVSFWVCAVPVLLTLAAAVFRGVRFELRFGLVTLAELFAVTLSVLEGGMLPNIPLYAAVLLTCTSLFFGVWAGVAMTGLLVAIMAWGAWGWTHGLLPLTMTASESLRYLLDFRSPYVWLRVLPITAVFVVALLIIMFRVVRRLRETYRKADLADRLLVLEQQHRAAAEAERNQQQTLFHVLFESSSDAVIILKDGRCVSCNKKAELMYGCTQEELRGKHPGEVSPPWQPDGRGSDEVARERICAALEGRPQRFEWQHKRADGTLFDAEVSLARVEFGSELLVQVVIRDITDIKRTELALRESEERYRRIASCVPDVIWIADCSGRFVYVNEVVERMFGQTVEDSLKLSIGDTVIPEYAARVRAMFEETLAAARAPDFNRNRIRTYELPEIRKDGSMFWAEVTSSILWSADGAPAGVIGVTRDITERREAAKALKEGEERYRRIARCIPDLLWIIDNAGRITYVNESVERITGWTVEEFQKLSIEDVMVPEDAARARAIYDTAVMKAKLPGYDRNRIVLNEYRNLKKDGSTFWAEVTSAFLWTEDGQPAGLIGTTRDVTERKLAAKAIRESEERYRRIACCVPDVIWICDLSGRFLYANEAVTRLQGWTPEEFLKLTYADVMDPEGATRAMAAIKDGLKRAKAPGYEQDPVRAFEAKAFKKDGSTFWAEVSAAFLLAEDRTPTGLIGSMRDITERKQSEQEREMLQTQLIQAQKMEAIGQLAGGVAHDFNNILTAILMQLNLLENESNVPDDVRRSLKEMEGMAQRATNLTRQLLLFSRRQVLQRQVLDLNSLLGNLLKMLRRLIGENIHLEFNGSGEALWLEADPGMLEQVVMNLVVNARDAMPRGGRVMLRTYVVTLDGSTKARHPEAREGVFVCLSVADTGSGIDSATAKRIFEPFFTTKEAGKGTGLGLATVYGIAKQHGGWVEMETQLGKGSAFTIFLPACAGGVLAAEPVPGGTLPRGRGERVLLVEDEAAVRQAVSDMLERLGYQVSAASDGAEAMGLWRKELGSFDLVLSDIVMPGGISGDDFAEQVLREKRDLRVVLMSGYRPEVRIHSPDLVPRISFLQKPFSATALADVLHERLKDD